MTTRGEQEGLEQGLEQEVLQTAKRMLEKGLTPKVMAELTGLSFNKISVLVGSGEDISTV